MNLEKQLGIKRYAEQFLFTYIDRQENMSLSVHIDYLNYRIKSVKRRHKHLINTSSQKLRHTFSTLAGGGGATIEQISRAVINSDT